MPTMERVLALVAPGARYHPCRIGLTREMATATAATATSAVVAAVKEAGPPRLVGGSCCWIEPNPKGKEQIKRKI